MIGKLTGRPEPVYNVTIVLVTFGALVLTGMVIWRGVDTDTAMAIGTLVALPTLVLSRWVRNRVTPLE